MNYKTILSAILLLFGGVLIAQDSTGTGESAFPVTWPDLFDLIDMVLVWAIGIAAGRWRQVLQAIASVFPFLESFVNQKDKEAVLGIAKAREARLLKRGKPLDLIVEVKDPGDPPRKIPPLSIFLLFFLPLGLSAQDGFSPPFEPAKAPAEYSTTARDGFRFYAMTQTGVSEINNGDTVLFDFKEPRIAEGDFSRFPIFFGDSAANYYEFRKYTDGDFWQVGYREEESSTDFGTKYPRYWEGLYYGLQLRDSLDGRFIRFYLKTNENLAIYTDTLKFFSVEPADLNGIIDKIDRIPTAGAIADSVASRLGRAGPSGITKSEAILAELNRPELDPAALAAKYYKSRPIPLEGFAVSTCDFVEWAVSNGEQISCGLSELVIFQVCKDIADRLGSSD